MKPSEPWHQAAMRQRWRAPWRCLVTAVAAGCLLMPGGSGAQVLRDNFADRDILTSPQGQLDGDNTGATLETGEPRHGGKPGGHSLWISWIAPTNGVVKFETGGSSFDTLLSAYFFASTNDTALEQLVELARADDSEGFGFESEVTFGVLAGQRYEIAVDGYHGAAGPLELEWDFQPTAVPPPIILSVPGDRAVRPGDSVTLEVGLANAANGRYRWFHNDTELESQETTLVIPAFQAAHVGRYKLRVSIDGPGYYSVPIEIQINSDGAADSLARDKTFDALGSPLRPARVGGGGGLWPAGVGVSRGYNGSQVFNTAYAAADPTEPNHCDLNGGASYWYAYQPPADGTLILDTVGSSYDTFIAAYTFDPPYSSYADLIPVACDDNGAGTNGAARLEVAAPQWRQFLVVVDGVNGARGTVHLNYRLDTNRPPVPPTLMQAPTPSRVAVGQDVTLQPMVSGSPPLRFTWRKDDRPLPDATNRVLWLQSVAPEHSGTYLVSVFNHVGGPLEVPMSLRVLVPPQLQCQRLPDGSELLWFISTAGQNYRVERADTLDGSWRMEPALYPGDGSVITLTNGTSNTAQFFRLRVE